MFHFDQHGMTLLDQQVGFVSNVIPCLFARHAEYFKDKPV